MTQWINKVFHSFHSFIFFFTAPAKPAKPGAEGTDIDKVKITYNFNVGGGYTHEFRVMYRKKSKLPRNSDNSAAALHPLPLEKLWLIYHYNVFEIFQI